MKLYLEIDIQMNKIGAGYLFSYWTFYKRRHEIVSKGLADFFDFDGDFMIDSGAFSAFNSDAFVGVYEYMKFIKELQPESNVTVVNLDVIGDPEESKQNYDYLVKKTGAKILPVVHYPSTFPNDLITNNYSNNGYVGLGGMVRALRILTKNQKDHGSPQQVARYLQKLKINRKYHGFGVGSPFHQLAFNRVLYSVDWVGYRKNAATCGVYTPVGTRVIPEARKREEKKYAPLSKEEFEKYRPPFIDCYEKLHLKGTEGWKWRALWSVWTFLCVDEYKEVMERNKYLINLKKITNKPNTANLSELME